MKLLIGTLLSSVAQLGGIMGLAMFFFLIFAILGVSLWDGKIHNRCYETSCPMPVFKYMILDNRFLSSPDAQDDPAPDDPAPTPGSSHQPGMMPVEFH